jgi:hypothetical protein
LYLAAIHPKNPEIILENLRDVFWKRWASIDRIFKDYELNPQSDLLSKLKEELVSPVFSWDSDFITEALNVSNSDWLTASEYPPLEWLACVITTYFLFGRIDYPNYLLFLKAINYHGLFILYDLIPPNLEENASLIDAFNYNKTLAKHFKDKGDMLSSLGYYRHAIHLAGEKREKNLTAYSLILIAKLYSDYWQRKGLYKAFNEIVYYRILNDTKSQNTRWYQICMDSYAKEIFTDNPELATSIFKSLLRQKSPIPDTHNRIKFRYLEGLINLHLERKEIFKLKGPIKDYQELLLTCQNNPKVIYIRKIHLVRFFRKIKESTDENAKKNLFFKSQISLLSNGEAAKILKESIVTAKRFFDRKFVALGYYELSHWIEHDDPQLTLNKRIEILLEGYNYFSGVDTTKIVTKTYINIVQGLAKLYVEKKDWESALSFYNKLYENLDNLTESLEKDTEIINQFLNTKNDEIAVIYPEFAYLSEAELYKIKDSVITDYAKLTRRLISHGDSIVSIQKLRLNSFFEMMHNFKHLITHDINRNIILIDESITNISHLLKENDQEHIDAAKNELTRAIDNIRSFQKLVIDETLSTEKIDVAKEIDAYISFYRQNNSNLIMIDFEKSNFGEIDLSSFLLNRIINNLIENAKHVGQKNKISRINIKFELEAENELLYLLVTDNCGDIGKLDVAIHNLNNNQTVESIKNASNRGEGLLAIKKILDEILKRKDIGWKVIKTKSKNKKSIKIPIAVID